MEYKKTSQAALQLQAFHVKLQQETTKLQEQVLKSFLSFVGALDQFTVNFSQNLDTPYLAVIEAEEDNCVCSDDHTVRFSFEKADGNVNRVTSTS